MYFTYFVLIIKVFLFYFAEISVKTNWSLIGKSGCSARNLWMYIFTPVCLSIYDMCAHLPACLCMYLCEREYACVYICA